MNDLELEVKFYVLDLGVTEARLGGLGARLIQPRTHELNIRFDTPQGDLTRTYQVLRLRQDTAARMTYKGPASEQEGVRVRQEIEFTVSDFGAARKLLLALGYQVAMIYEKYRRVYDLDGVHITLDEMPYGNFVEIEGPDTNTIKALNQKLGLDWQARVPASYAVLFSQLKLRKGLPFRDLVFDNFEGLEVLPQDLGVKAADE